MKIFPFFALASFAAADSSQSIASSDLVFAEKDGLVAIEAEHFIKQEKTAKRAWYLTTREETPDITPDGDPSHIVGASGGAYLEILPDTRRNHDQKLIVGENFTNQPGKMAVLSYKVHFTTPGKYWLWARAYSTTTEDNGLHFGIDGTWPESAQRWQTVVKNRWHWKSAQRTKEVHSGVPGILTLDVPTAGEHLIQVSMREDGAALDKILLVNREDYKPEGVGISSAVKSGTPPPSFPFVAAKSVAKEKEKKPESPQKPVEAKALSLPASSFDLTETNYYLDKGKWAAINPAEHQTARVMTASPFPDGSYHITLEAVGEEDGASTYSVLVNGTIVGQHTCPLSQTAMEEGRQFHGRFERVGVAQGDVIEVVARVASSDGKEYARARWAGLRFQPADEKTARAVAQHSPAKKKAASDELAGPSLQQPRQANGDGTIAVSGDLKQWHKVTLTLDGPYAHERDKAPNPFTDYALNVTFTHPAGGRFTVPGYFAADGKAAETSAQAGTKWKVHFAPNAIGEWSYEVSFVTAPLVANGGGDGTGKPVAGLHQQKGTFTIGESEETGRDFRSRGRLSYVGKNHLQFEGDQTYFLKAGADAPETLLAFKDFDDTQSLNEKKGPLKTFSSHVADWREGDPTWQNGKGKGLIGALNYLAGKGVNSFSFLPYNVDGDGSNVWPFIEPRAKFHYDCSKLDQWGIVFDHATAEGLYLHFKLQETEIDDNRRGQKESGAVVRSSLDGGKMGPERRLYCREMVARFGHLLALNWNIGEENTQTTEEIQAMADYLKEVDPYDHLIVLHTYPRQQNKQYRPLLGYDGLTGLSLQNEWKEVHHLTAKWIRESNEAGHPWVCANDEQGPASLGVPPDPDYPGATEAPYTIDDIRKYTLWGNLMAGGAGVEYYFGYKLAENDLRAEDFRSRDQSWDYCRIALDFFSEREIPFAEMTVRDDLVGNPKNENSRYCLAKEGELYLVYLPKGGSCEVKLPEGAFQVSWFNPRTGESQQWLPLAGQSLAAPDSEDWLAEIRIVR